MSKPKPILCQCGEEMFVTKTFTTCPHCDVPHGGGDCPTCRRYGYWLNMRIINEFNAERKKKRETGQW